MGDLTPIPNQPSGQPAAPQPPDVGVSLPINSPADSPIPPADSSNPVISPIPVSSTPEPNRPDSILPDQKSNVSTYVQPEGSSQPADSSSPPVQTIPADLSSVASIKVDKQPVVASPSAQPTQTSPQIPTDPSAVVSTKGGVSLPEASASARPAPANSEPGNQQTATSQPKPPASIPEPSQTGIPVPEAKSESTILSTQPINQPSQVPPEKPVNAPDVPADSTSQSTTQSAGINPQPPQPVQTGFGSLMDTTKPQAVPTTTPPSEPSSSSVPSDPSPDASTVRRQHAAVVRKQNREKNLSKLIELVEREGKVDNLTVRDYLHVSQTTATDYLRTLVDSGKLQKSGKAKATKYSLQ